MNIWSLLEGQRPLPHTVAQAPVLNLRIPVVLAIGGKQRLEVASQRFCSLIVQVTTGALDVCLSDSAETQPDFRFQAGLGPQQVWVPYEDYTLSVSNPANQTTVAVLRILG